VKTAMTLTRHRHLQRNGGPNQTLRRQTSRSHYGSKVPAVTVTDITIFFPNKTFHFVTTIKLIYYIGISIFDQLFFLCFLKYEFSPNCVQSYYKNIGYFEGLYTCENLTFHLQTEKDVKFASEMVSVFTQCITSLEIAINYYFQCSKEYSYAVDRNIDV
jgi:hypothetical protein